MKSGWNALSSPALVLALLLGMACAPKVAIRSAPCLYESNQIRKIAVFGSGMVQWPDRSGGSLLGLTESKQALAEVMLQTEASLKTKGYEVSLCRPAGIGYFGAKRAEWSVYESPNPAFNKLTEDSKWTAAKQEPVFLFNRESSPQELTDAINGIFAEMETALDNKGLSIYVPSANHLDTLKKHVDADAFVFVRVGGSLYSTGRQAGALARDVGLALLGVHTNTVPTDTVVPHCLIVSSTTKEVLWQRDRTFQTAPIRLRPDAMDLVLEPFPVAGRIMDPTFRPDPPK